MPNTPDGSAARPTLVERARQAQRERDGRSDDLAASWLARSRHDAVRRWESTLGPTEPEQWADADPDCFEHNRLRTCVDGLWFTQGHYYSNGTHHYYLLLDGSEERIWNAVTLGDAIDDARKSVVTAPVRTVRKWWRRGR